MTVLRFRFSCAMRIHVNHVSFTGVHIECISCVAGTLPAALPHSLNYFDASINNITGKPTSQLYEKFIQRAATGLTVHTPHRDPTSWVGRAGKHAGRAGTQLKLSSWHAA